MSRRKVYNVRRNAKRDCKGLNGLSDGQVVMFNTSVNERTGKTAVDAISLAE